MIKLRNISTGFAVLSFALTALADSGPNHQSSQTRPIQLGTSGGNLNEFFTCPDGTYCSSGTLGALVKDGNGTLYILSNNHVLSRTEGGCLPGDAISQPGLVDANCSLAASSAVANLTTCVPLNFSGGDNKVDAAMAEVIPGDVDPNGAILDIGQASTNTVAPKSRLKVKKSGRTTGTTKGSIAAVNVTINVDYDPCGTSPKVARFVNQIAISPGTFSAGGDSGALIVEDVASCPRPVGLLFAGSSFYTFANRISDVMAELSVGMVGCTNAPSGGGHGPKPRGAQVAGVPADAVAAATKAKERAEDALLKIAGVRGAGVSSSDTDETKAVVEIYVEKDTPELRRALPKTLDGVPVRVVETGRIVAY
jgi:hypothetical protein